MAAVEGQATQLDFHQAMEDFKTMFPDVDADVIEVSGAGQAVVNCGVCLRSVGIDVWPFTAGSVLWFPVIFDTWSYLVCLGWSSLCMVELNFITR